MSVLETISVQVFNISYSAWTLFQPKCLIFLFSMGITEESKNILSSLFPFQKKAGLEPFAFWKLSRLYLVF